MNKKNITHTFSKKNTYLTISDKVGCSISTISRYFNNGYISEIKKQKIADVINSLNYIQSPIARAMRHGDNAVFLLTMSIKNATNFSVIEGICNSLQDTPLFLNYANNNQIIFQKSLNLAALRHPLALVIFADKISSEIKKQFIKSNIPIFYYSHKEFKKNQSLFFNYYIDEQEAFDELLNNMVLKDGLVNIFFINYKHDQNCSSTNSFLQNIRKKCIEKSLKKIIKKNNIKCKITFFRLKNNYFKDIGIWLKKQKWEINTGIICASHTIFRSLRHLSNLEKNIIVSDIGYQSLTDHKEILKYKIFIDYYALGVIMGKEILNWIREKKLPKSNLKFSAKLITYSK